MHPLISTITESELLYIAGLDYGSDLEQHYKALRSVIFEQDGEFREGQAWFPYEVVELGKNSPQPSHEREFVICTLLVINAVKSRFDTWSDLTYIFDSMSHYYQQLPRELSAILVEAFVGADC